MSDGPHRSLPMSPPWRTVAERAVSPVFAPNEIGNALVVALTRDWHADIPADLVRSIGQILADPQHLFRDDRVRRLESLRPITAAHGFAQLLLDCSIERAVASEIGTEAVVTAAANALAVRASRGAHQVEEHYRRGSKAPGDQNVRARIEQGIGGASFTDLARRLLSRAPGLSSRAPVKQRGLDDGVPL